jgi:hypothetical protein
VARLQNSQWLIPAQLRAEPQLPFLTNSSQLRAMSGYILIKKIIM